jgi:hypothetical protein
MDRRGAPPGALADPAARVEAAIDEVLAESFPPSDAPPWTLGLDRDSVFVPEGSEDREDADRGTRTSRRT